MSKKIGAIYNPLTGLPAGEDFLKKLITEVKLKRDKNNGFVRNVVVAGKQNVELTEQERVLLKAIASIIANPIENDSGDFMEVIIFLF